MFTMKRELLFKSSHLMSSGQVDALDRCADEGLPEVKYDFPEIDWSLYGLICFSQRSAVIKALSRPMQPSEIKRMARFHDPNLRMSANNVRDIIRLLLEKGVVRRVVERGKAHPKPGLNQKCSECYGAA